MNFVILLFVSIVASALWAGDYYVMYDGSNYSIAGLYEVAEVPEQAVCKAPMNGENLYMLPSLKKQGDGITPDCDMETPATLDSALHAAYLAELALRPQRRTAIAALRTSLIAKTWDEMSVAERKVHQGLVPTDVELGL